jgi:hypothetical protein
MEIEGKEFMDWLHDVRKKMRIQEKKSGLSGEEWMRTMASEVERIIGKKIPKNETVVRKRSSKRRSMKLK